MKKKTKNSYSMCTAILQNFTVICHLYVKVRSNSQISSHPHRLYQNGEDNYTFELLNNLQF